MVLVDTSVWIDHLRRGNRLLVERLEAGDVATHPFIRGEVACVNLRNRDEILVLLDALPLVSPVEDTEARVLVERERLFGSGLGWIDVHLLASARLAGCTLWTLDRSLASAASRLKI